MKLFHGIFLIVAMAVLSSCSPSKDLTDVKVTNALGKANLGGAKVNIVGIHQSAEIDGSRIVDINITNFSYLDPNYSISGRGPSVTYSGPGTLIFQGYTDGRWVLVGMQVKDSHYSRFNFNIPAE